MILVFTQNKDSFDEYIRNRRPNKYRQIFMVRHLKGYEPGTKYVVLSDFYKGTFADEIIMRANSRGFRRIDLNSGITQDSQT